MNDLRIGELFSGYGGLGMGVQSVYGGTVAWHSDIDKGANKVLAHRYPDVPNLGDITTVDWSQVEPVDILTGGSPCQDLSHAGRRAGMTDGTRSNLWVAMREAIAQLRPTTVAWENVRGAYSAAADSEVEPCPGCVGDGSGVHLRALGRVLGDLSDLGYDCRWHGLRAADVGAPHGRFRVFVVATDAAGSKRQDQSGRHDPRGPLVGTWAEPGSGVDAGHPAEGVRVLGGSAGLLPTPRSSDTNGSGAHGEGGVDLRTAISLLPTPAVNDMGEGKTVTAWDEWTAKMKAAHGNGNGHGASLAIEAARLLQTRSVADGAGGHERRGGKRGQELLLNGQAKEMRGGRWGAYAAAIARWETVLGRPAPEPTTTSTKGNPQLSSRFVEWLMGLPEGWVTDVPGVTRNEALKLLGNGVVSQQCAEALRVMESWVVAA